MNSGPVLSIENLRTYFFSRSKQAFIRSVDGVNLQIDKGQTLGIVGESGSGKSVTALSTMGLISSEPGVIIGKIGLKTESTQKNLLQDLKEYVRINMSTGRIMDVYKDTIGWQKKMDRIMKGIRGREISMIFQNPKLSMNPFSSVGKQITESILLNTSIKNRYEAKDRAVYWLEQVKMDSPRLRYHNNPYGLSGGMCQRAMIAMALSSEPSLLIADEPTTGLDATIQSKIVKLLADIKSSFGVTTMLISHDIDVIRSLSDNVAVMYGGTVLEHGPAMTILSSDYKYKHPYTSALLASIPTKEHVKQKMKLKAIKGDVLDTINIPVGCRFYSRCNQVTDTIRENCELNEPDLKEVYSGHKVRCWRFV